MPGRWHPSLDRAGDQIEEARMRVGVLGSGQVGQALGRGFASRQHEVMLGTRSPESERVQAWVVEGEARSAGTFAEAAAFGEVIVLATLGLAAEEALELAGPDRLAGKAVIDATNPLEYLGDGSVRLGFGFDDSLGERVQRKLPESKVVKAFNTVGNPYMVDPDLPGGPPTMLICGNDAEAKATVSEICEDFGWETADLGPIERSRALEEVAMAWVYYGQIRGTWDHAFKMLHK
jgi:8-hydroxy-5-deazaflavin:NADPH oxidoreductase